MAYVIVGLGNPGKEYEKTRHNTGRIILDSFRKANKIDDWCESKKMKALVSDGRIGREKMQLLLPETFMNKSGVSLRGIISSPKKAEKLIVVYDDLDLPLGHFKISFGRGSGGHKGIESIIRSIKTKNFIRVRVGVALITPSGKLKKPKGDQKVLDFLMGDFKAGEFDILKKVSKKITEAIEIIISEGRTKAMNKFN